ncbi:hypothetical protein HDA32_001556 [Spinactinospora alkalitolerans]|uniref:DUF7455 domain-containing protein n=1 Tax=Spinactinospora alkalitolerans TaxID=687207 RepID=A0A852TPX9_9ACTN|nr:hypothetical protein [Spinactinospora alkalitolerans]
MVLNSGGELLFCAHHMRKHDDSLRRIASEIQDETDRLHSTPATAAENER